MAYLGSVNEFKPKDTFPGVLVHGRIPGPALLKATFIPMGADCGEHRRAGAEAGANKAGHNPAPTADQMSCAVWANVKRGVQPHNRRIFSKLPR